MSCVDASMLQSGLLRTTASTLTLGVPQNANVQIQYYDNSNQPVGSPVPMATQKDIAAINATIALMQATLLTLTTGAQVRC